MKRHDIAKELGVDPATISRDTAYLVSESQHYLNSLAKETLPFMYQTSIEGIRAGKLLLNYVDQVFFRAVFIEEQKIILCNKFLVLSVIICNNCK
jgi:hypothetical protein